MSNLNIVTLAPLLSTEQSAGHVFWIHSTLHESFNENHYIKHLTVSPKKNAPDWAIGTLEISAKARRRFSHFPFFRLNRDVKSLESLLQSYFGRNSSVHIHVYDGGFREYLLVSRLLRLHPGRSSSFNFANWLDPWAKYLVNLGAKKKWWGLSKKNEERFLGNQKILMYTETKAFAGLFPNWFPKPNIYPSFSTIASLIGGALPAALSTEKSIDIIFFPETQEEVDFALDVVRDLGLKIQGEIKSAIQPRWGLNLSEDIKRKLRDTGVRLFRDHLPLSEFAEMFLQSKVVVLPYRRMAAYSVQGSGRLLDAISAGCKVIVPEATALEELCESDGQVRSASMNHSLDVADLAAEHLESGASFRSTRYTPSLTVRAIALDAKDAIEHSFEKQFRSVSKAKTVALGFAYITLDWYQPLVGIVKALGLSDKFLAKIRNTLYSILKRTSTENPSFSKDMMVESSVSNYKSVVNKFEK